MTDYLEKRPVACGPGEPPGKPIGALSMRRSRPNSRAQEARSDCPFLTSKEAAFYLGLAVVTLKGMRKNGTGPKCRKHGRDWRYHIADLDAWSLSRSTGGGHD